jgi:sulfur relay (sulfurtransferase) complex TusBCD TusD component (DsrE family)
MTNPNAETVILVTRNGMGDADVELQQKLIQVYFNLLIENDCLPPTVCFYADGVKLAVSGSPLLEQLKVMEAMGVRLILCSTCLNYFGLVEQLQVGIVGGMTDILEAQLRAAKVISI